ncbi:transposase, partial [bacterium]|nr:transposase [bacterium]
MNKSMSFFEFKERFPDEDACFDYMVKVRWPNGFFCPRCSHQHAYPIRKRKLFQCADCRHQVSVTAGTVFHKLRQPLQKLFWAMYWVAAQ